jgi:hypothetical protein
MAPVILEPLLTLLSRMSQRLVVIGSVARGVRQGFAVWPKDIDFLIDMDSETSINKMRQNIEALGVEYTSPFIRAWTFGGGHSRDYGWMVEIIGIHYGPSYRIVRRRADKIVICDLELLVAKPEDTPKVPAKKVGDWLTWPGERR